MLLNKSFFPHKAELRGILIDRFSVHAVLCEQGQVSLVTSSK